MNIFQEIQKDSQIGLNLSAESLKIPQLQSKWITILAGETKKLKVLQDEFAKIVKERTLYYMGKLPDDIYKQEPLNHKVLKQDLQTFLDADEKYSEAKKKVDDQVILVNSIELFMKDLSQRSFNIKNAIEYQKFMNGIAG